ncbi:substrate-binding domain-containing protein [Pseudomonas sp. BMS12]|uniref:substrate-binding domain-containing protein n=1 Tax=Pseudomonas sp. BMS12 TaxID=1796033 RepID=UPI00083B890B|nr:substrate-binding domain-containing protein [Pseudomonas sp. BMS12]
MPIRASACLLAALLASDGATAQERCISLVTSAGGQVFWRQVREGAEAVAAELGIPLYARGPSRDGDVAVQLELIERMGKFNCGVLIVAPSGPAVATRMAELRAQGTQGIYIDRDLGDKAVLAAIATDNHAAGLLAGQQLARLLGGRGKVALLRLNAQVQSTSERERGFLDGARAGGLHVALDRYLPQDEPSKMADLSQELQGLDGLFTPSEGTTLETLAVLRRARLVGKLVHVGFDSSPLLIEALRQDELAGLMVQQPAMIGAESVLRARRILDGDLEGARRVALPAIYVDKRNLDEPAVQRLLLP